MKAAKSEFQRHDYEPPQVSAEAVAKFFLERLLQMLFSHSGRCPTRSDRLLFEDVVSFRKE